MGHGEDGGGGAVFPEGGVQRRLGGGLWLEEDAADKVVVHFRDQIDGRLLQHHRDSGRLVPAQLEITGDALYHGMRGRRGEQPVRKGLAAQAFRAGADQDDGAAVLDGVLCVVQRLLRLVQIGVLRRAAGISGKIMKLDVAQADPEVGFCDCAGDIHRRSACGVAQVDAVGRIGVDAADRLIAFPADQDGGGMEDAKQILLRKLHSLHTIAISKFQLHGPPPVFRYSAQILATPVLLAASATALATAGPTRWSKALGMI